MYKIKLIAKYISCLFFRICNNINLSHEKNVLIYKCKLNSHNSNNKIILKTGATLKNCSFVIKGNNNRINIGTNSRFIQTTFWLEGDNNSIIIGNNTTMESQVNLAACEGTSIYIGDNCMFSHNIYIRTTDSHSIINESNIRINKAQNILINDNVWIGMQSIILKGVNIPRNCIIAARSLITNKEYKSNTIIGGHPAKILKENVRWIREQI